MYCESVRSAFLCPSSAPPIAAPSFSACASRPSPGQQSHPGWACRTNLGDALILANRQLRRFRCCRWSWTVRCVIPVLAWGCGAGRDPVVYSLDLLAWVSAVWGIFGLLFLLANRCRWWLQVNLPVPYLWRQRPLTETIPGAALSPWNLRRTESQTFRWAFPQPSNLLNRSCPNSSNAGHSSNDIEKSGF